MTIRPGDLFGFLNVLFAGLLAGEELVIRYGVREPLAGLERTAHLRLRQLLIRKLRVLVPIGVGCTLISALLAWGWGGSAHGFRFAGLAFLAVFLSITLAGTVPINQAVLQWDPSAPPDHWQSRVRRWEQLDTWRCWAAFAAFACFLQALFEVP